MKCNGIFVIIPSRVIPLGDDNVVTVPLDSGIHFVCQGLRITLTCFIRTQNAVACSTHDGIR